MASVALENVTKVYEKHVVAVDSANINIEDREFIILVGPSGCGKSTILRMIAGLEQVSSGSIRIDGRIVNDLPPKDRDIAMVFQNYALYPHMTVYQNMAFGLKLHKFGEKDIAARVKEAADLLGISHLLDRKPKALSGGQRQRVAVGRAIVRKPKVFLFDEPLSNLDAKLRVQMRTEISKLHSRLRATMIYVTHDQVEAMTMGDRIIVLRDGRIQQIDRPLDLYRAPATLFVAGFIGSPAMNFLRGCIAATDDGLQFQSPPLIIRLPDEKLTALWRHKDQQVWLGIRPENIIPTGGRGIRCRVEVVEPMGNETFINLNAGPHFLTMRIAPATDLKPGIEIDVSFDMQHAHFFDIKSEESIN